MMDATELIHLSTLDQLAESLQVLELTYVAPLIAIAY